MAVIPTMRVTPLEGRAAPLLLRALNHLVRRRLGQELLPLKVLAHNPRFLLPYLATSAFSTGRVRLPAQTRGLAMALVAELNGCAWCVDFGRAIHGRTAAERERLALVRRYAGPEGQRLFTPAERAALAYAEAVTQLGARVADEVFAELRRHFSEREIVELTAAVAVENFYNRLNAALQVEAQGFCAVLPVAGRHA